MENLVSKIHQWVLDRNIQTADSKVQMCKTMEELGELARGLNKGNSELVKDSIGDVVVTLIAICAQQGVDFNQCLEVAYNEIKDRKGKMINGIFVKEADMVHT